MDETVDYAKKEFLEAMYRSVERMNQHTVEGNEPGVLSEQALQMSLRRDFEELHDKEG